MNEIHKEYASPFLLEPTKLNRIIDKMHERLRDHDPTMKLDKFDVFLSGNQHQQLHTIDEVLALDNSRKQRIDRFIVCCSGGRKVAARHDDEIQVGFGAQVIIGTSTSKVISIRVRSDDTAWANRVLYELEEQIERTRLSYTQPLLLLLGLVLVGLIFLLSLTSRLEFRWNYSSTMWLREAELDRVEQMVGNGRTLTNEDVREIETMQLRNLLELNRPKQSSHAGWGRQSLLIGVPFLFMVACSLWLLLTCYPTAVFSWGDGEARYSAILQRRKVLWGVLISVFVVGILSNFFSAGVASWLLPA
jgi:hypothetical protein